MLKIIHDKTSRRRAIPRWQNNYFGARPPPCFLDAEATIADVFTIVHRQRRPKPLQFYRMIVSRIGIRLFADALASKIVYRNRHVLSFNINLQMNISETANVKSPGQQRCRQ